MKQNHQDHPVYPLSLEMNFLEVRNVSFSFPSGSQVLKEITFSLNEGDLTIIAGKNGSGKTVLMKQLNGILLPDEGEVLFKGMSTRNKGEKIREKVGLVFQDADSCLVGQTVWDDLMFGPENLMIPEEERFFRGKTILRRFGIFEKRGFPPRFLSGGEKKKLTLAGILVMNPEVIILDEPFVGLDYPGVRELIEILVSLKEEGRTVVVISHDLEKILAHGDRLLILDEGRLAADGKPEELLHRLGEWGIRRPPEKNISGMTWLTS